MQSFLHKYNYILNLFPKCGDCGINKVYKNGVCDGICQEKQLSRLRISEGKCINCDNKSLINTECINCSDIKSLDTKYCKSCYYLTLKTNISTTLLNANLISDLINICLDYSQIIIKHCKLNCNKQYYKKCKYCNQRTSNIICNECNTVVQNNIDFSKDLGCIDFLNQRECNNPTHYDLSIKNKFSNSHQAKLSLLNLDNCYKCNDLCVKLYKQTICSSCATDNAKCLTSCIKCDKKYYYNVTKIFRTSNHYFTRNFDITKENDYLSNNHCDECKKKLFKSKKCLQIDCNNKVEDYENILCENCDYYIKINDKLYQEHLQNIKDREIEDHHDFMEDYCLSDDD